MLHAKMAHTWRSADCRGPGEAPPLNLFSQAERVTFTELVCKHVANNCIYERSTGLERPMHGTLRRGKPC